MIRDHRPMQPRPRVLAVAQSADLGGAELALMRVAERLPDLGFDVELASPDPTRASGPPARASASPRPGHASASAPPGHASASATHRLPIGRLSPGAWPRALAAWPRAHRLAR